MNKINFLNLLLSLIEYIFSFLFFIFNLKLGNLFIISLAIADLIVGSFVMPMATIYAVTEKWTFGKQENFFQSNFHPNKQTECFLVSIIP